MVLLPWRLVRSGSLVTGRNAVKARSGILGSLLSSSFDRLWIHLCEGVPRLGLFPRSYEVVPTNSDRYAVTDTITTAMAASICNHRLSHGRSTCPLLMSLPTALMMQTIAVKTLRQRIAPRTSFRRRAIWLRQSRATGMETTPHLSAKQCRGYFHTYRVYHPIDRVR